MVGTWSWDTEVLNERHQEGGLDMRIIVVGVSRVAVGDLHS